jgi:pimeloyl-ACP methyl ester carboxylesterase
MSAVAQRGFVRSAFGEIHYRYAGRGAPVVLLHPSPLSSAAMWPIAEKLCTSHAVYAFDTPGYGFSDSLAAANPSLDDYAQAFSAATRALGIDRFALIGAATGAQIAIEWAKREPERIALLVADSACHFEDHEREAILQRYFLDLTPRDDGAHLLAAWQMARDLFLSFPWFDTRAAARLDRDIPPAAVVHAVTMDYLRAGADYALAYRLAFANERAAQVQALRVPTVIARWTSSILLKHTDALLAHTLPPNVTVLPIAAGPDARVAALADAVRQHFRCGQWSTPHGALSPTRRFDQGIVWRGNRSGSAVPTLYLHDVGASGARWAEPSGQALIPDWPGHGGSAPMTTPTLDGCALQLKEWLAALGVDRLRVVGRHVGGRLALALAKHLKVDEVVHVGLAALDPSSARHIAAHLPDLTPSDDGTHLLRAWHAVRDHALFWPWCARRAANRRLIDLPSAARLTERVIDLLTPGPALSGLLHDGLDHASRALPDAPQQRFARTLNDPPCALAVKTWIDLPRARATWPEWLRPVETG